MSSRRPSRVDREAVRVPRVERVPRDLRSVTPAAAHYDKETEKEAWASSDKETEEDDWISARKS